MFLKPRLISLCQQITGWGKVYSWSQENVFRDQNTGMSTSLPSLPILIIVTPLIFWYHRVYGYNYINSHYFRVELSSQGRKPDFFLTAIKTGIFQHPSYGVGCLAPFSLLSSHIPFCPHSFQNLILRTETIFHKVMTHICYFSPRPRQSTSINTACIYASCFNSLQ